MCRSSYHHYRYEDRRSATPLSVSDPVASPDTIRVSDTDRNRVIELLKQHTADGRLTLEEFETRVDETLAARTGSELRMVLRELPVPDRVRPRPRSVPSVGGRVAIPRDRARRRVLLGRRRPPAVVAAFRSRLRLVPRRRWPPSPSPLGPPARGHRSAGHHDVHLGPDARGCARSARVREA